MVMYATCCCGLCKCIGCVNITLSGMAPVVSGSSAWNAAVTRAYNRTFNLWTRAGDTRTPFTGLEGATSICSSDTIESYPGTACVMVADACCLPDTDDPLEDPDPPPPPPPPP